MCLKTFRTLVMASVLSCLLGLPSSTASADLVPVTDPQSPGGLDNVTRDTNTDLEWLDWTASTDRSYDDVSDLTDSGETYQGWRHATREEVKVLFGNAGLPVESWPTDSEIETGEQVVNSFFDLFGKTSGCDCTTHAITADNLGAVQYFATAYRPDSYPNGSGTRAQYSKLHDDEFSFIGHALVRDSTAAAIPEPTSLMYLALVGLVGAGICGWNKLAS